MVKSRTRKRWPRLILLTITGIVIAFYSFCTLAILAMRWINPPTTVVQIERRVEAWRTKRSYRKRFSPVPMAAISLSLQHAVVAAEDARFYQHHGFDWIQVQKVVQTDLAKHRLGRGASTITQQLVKNVFFGTERSIIRKGLEFTVVPVMEALLPKKRILELYLNLIEWGPGVYGAQAACEFWYHVPAAKVGREESARLAAIIPSPLRRTPARENEYSADILNRLREMGW